jgi:hypothetical protein
MYGCSKPHVKPYLLTHVFDHNLIEITYDHLTEKDLIMEFSIRKGDEITSYPIRPEYKHLLEPKIKKIKITKQQIKIGRTFTMAPTFIREEGVMGETRFPQVDRSKIMTLINLLKQERTDLYKKWIRVAWALYNIGYEANENLIDIWLQFSQRSNKYNQEDCVKRLSDISYHADGLKMGSLVMWAQKDSPEQYKKIFGNDIESVIFMNLSTTSYDVATVIATHFHNRWVYADKKITHGTILIPIKLFANGLLILTEVNLFIKYQRN